MKFGFVGLGQMGAPMAINLAKRHSVLVFDKNRNSIEGVIRKGAQPVDNLAQFSKVDVLITCLPNALALNEALFGDEIGLFKYLQPDALVVDTSTIERDETLKIGARLKKAGFRFLDAPVSGMQKRAEDGTLTMMVGGNLQDLTEVEAALSSMASKVIHMGDTGSGQLAKLINQLLFNINAAALAEILPMAVKLGIDPKQITDVINSGTGRSFATEFFAPNILKGDFSKGYPMQAAYKDLISGTNLSAQYTIPTPVLAAATSTYQQTLLEGHGSKDKGAMILVYEKLMGVAFRATSSPE